MKRTLNLNPITSDFFTIHEKRLWPHLRINELNKPKSSSYNLLNLPFITLSYMKSDTDYN